MNKEELVELIKKKEEKVKINDIELQKYKKNQKFNRNFKSIFEILVIISTLLLINTILSILMILLINNILSTIAYFSIITILRDICFCIGSVLMNIFGLKIDKKAINENKQRENNLIQEQEKILQELEELNLKLINTENQDLEEVEENKETPSLEEKDNKINANIPLESIIYEENNEIKDEEEVLKRQRIKKY